MSSLKLAKTRGGGGIRGHSAKVKQRCTRALFRLSSLDLGLIICVRENNAKTTT